MLSGPLLPQQAKPKPKIIRRRKLDSDSIEKLISKLNDLNWNRVLERYYDDANNSYDAFLQHFLTIYDSCCPIENKVVKVCTTNKPWLTPGLKALMLACWWHFKCKSVKSFNQLSQCFTQTLPRAP